MSHVTVCNDLRALELAWNGCAPDPVRDCEHIRAAWRRQAAAGYINGYRLTAPGERVLLEQKPHLKLLRPFHAD